MTKHFLIALALLTLMATAPATAQTIDLSGVWAPIMHEDQPERGPGPDVGDFLGLPISDAARMRAETWDTSILTVPEHQCKPHPATYGFRGIGNLRITTEVDDATQRLVRLSTQIQWMEQKRDIWMDGRPHPPEYAAHTWQGFSTGRFEGNQLIVRTTHLKSHWVRRNGVFLSDKATMEERFMRHGDTMTHVYMISDPYFLTEPLVKTNGFRFNQSNAPLEPYPCDTVIEIVRERGVIPHKLPSDKHFLMEFASKHKLPYEATRGGAHTALPEYARQLAAQPPAATRSAR